EVVDAPHHLVDAGGLRVPRREVLAQAVAQAQSLADIYDLRATVAEQVHAGLVRHRAQALSDRLFLLSRHREGLKEAGLDCPREYAAERRSAASTGHAANTDRRPADSAVNGSSS